jgi:CheY-like chemotaxis protein
MAENARTILIVDPTEAGEKLARFCADHGLTVLRARSAEQALDFIIEAKPEAAIIELELPDAPGSDLAQILSGDVRVPLFLATASRLSADDPLLDSELLGVEALLAKPYNLEQVLSALAKVLGTAVEALGAAAAASVDSSGKRWGADDLADVETVVVLDEVVAEASNGLEGPLPTQPLEDATRAAAVDSPSALDLVAIWERKVEAYRSVEGQAPQELGERSGSLGPGTVCELFDRFYRARRSGELALQHGKAKRLIVFADGNPVFARSNIVRERVGSQLVQQGLVTESLLRDALIEAGGNDQRVGDVLVARGALSDDNRRRVLQRTVTQIVLASFAWTQGEYQIGLVERARVEPFHVPLFTGNAILRGLALTTPVEVLGAAVPLDARYAPVADPPYPMERLKLSAVEARLVISADGTKTVADLTALYDLPVASALALLYGLARLGVIELVGRGQAQARKISFF